MSFIETTHFKNWIFTKEQLFEQRSKANKKCKFQLQDFNDNLELCISEVEEGKVVDSFLNMIRHFYRKFTPTLPTQVYGVSVTYFRRFFLKYSVMDFHPREIIVACIYIACKICDFSISMETFLKNIPKNSEKYHSFIYESELFIMNELNYDLWIVTPYESFKAYMVELNVFHVEAMLSVMDVESQDVERQKLINEKEVLREQIKTGINIINDWYETDLMMMFYPSHVALAAVEASTSTNQAIFKEFVKRKVVNDNEAKFIEVLDILERIKSFIHHELVVVGVDNLKLYEHRVDACRNPKYNVQSSIYQELKERYDEKNKSFE